jgi:hypothetical protein
MNRRSVLKRLSVMSVCSVLLGCATISLAADLHERAFEGKETQIKVPEFRGALKAVPNPPGLFFTAPARNCSSFDLKGGTLNYVGDTFAQVFPLIYQGKIGNLYFFWESSPYGWQWYFEDKGGTNGAVYYQVNPTQPVREFDTAAKRLDREP